MKAGSLIEGKYRLTRVIGEGAMGVVWEALHEGTSRQVAIKLILRPTEELRHRLIREAKACGALRHRNIVDIYDVGTTAEGDPFLVMQLLVGETLAERLARQRRLDTPEATRIGRDVARALSAAHAASIIHRDLKPANIFLHDEPGEESSIIKVLDFGVSKNLATSDGLATMVGGVVGSPAYMSPEQAGMGASVDPRADLWSLGVVLFEMLTGKRPLDGDPTTILQRLFSAEIPPATNFLRTLDPTLSALVARCLARNPSKRIGSATELSTQLQRWAGAGTGSGGSALGQSGSPCAASIPPPPALFATSPEVDPALRSPQLQGGQLPAAPRMPEGNDDDNQQTTKLDPRMLAPVARARAHAEPALPSTAKLEPAASWSTDQAASAPALAQEVAEGGTVRLSFDRFSNFPPPPLEVPPVAPAAPPLTQTSTTAPLLQIVRNEATRKSDEAPLTKPRFTGTALVAMGSGAGVSIAALVVSAHALFGATTATPAPGRPESMGVVSAAVSVAPPVVSPGPLRDPLPPKPPPPPPPPPPRPSASGVKVALGSRPKGETNVPPWLIKKTNPTRP